MKLLATVPRDGSPSTRLSPSFLALIFLFSLFDCTLIVYKYVAAQFCSFCSVVPFPIPDTAGYSTIIHCKLAVSPPGWLYHRCDRHDHLTMDFQLQGSVATHVVSEEWAWRRCLARCVQAPLHTQNPFSLDASTSKVFIVLTVLQAVNSASNPTDHFLISSSPKILLSASSLSHAMRNWQ